MHQREPLLSERTKALKQGYFALLIFLISIFYVLPEVVAYRLHGLRPSGPLAIHPSSGTSDMTLLLKDLWSEKSAVLNPVCNPLVRFFLIAVIIGLVLDRYKRYSSFRES